MGLCLICRFFISYSRNITLYGENKVIFRGRFFNIIKRVNANIYIEIYSDNI